MNLQIQRWRRFSSISNKCLVYTPVAMNSAPSFIIVASTRSPLRSTNVTPVKSTMHLRFPFRPWDFSQFDLSCATHGPDSRPCRVHLCSSGSSALVILSTAFSRSRSEIAHEVPFFDLEMKFSKVAGVTADRMEKKIKLSETWQRASARLVALCRFHGTEESLGSAGGKQNLNESGNHETGWVFSRERPSLRMRNCSVERFIPNRP